MKTKWRHISNDLYTQIIRPHVNNFGLTLFIYEKWISDHSSHMFFAIGDVYNMKRSSMKMKNYYISIIFCYGNWDWDWGVAQTNV